MRQDIEKFSPHRQMLLVAFSFILTLCTYLVLTWKFFPLDPNSGWAVFLAPRSYGGMNDLPSSPFSQWRELLVLLVSSLMYFRLIHPKVSGFSFRSYLILSYFLTFIVSFGFVLISSNGIYQYVLQAKSVNNGIVYSIGYLLELPAFASESFMGKLNYVFATLGSNDSGYTIPGTTHPPAVFLIFFLIAGLAKTLAFGSEEISDLMIAWTLVVTLINCFLIPLLLMIIKQIFGESVSRRSLYYLLGIPSVTFHVCAMGEIFGSIALLSAIYLSVKLIQLLKEMEVNPRRESLLLLGIGFCFTFQAQISYSQLIPIFCFGIMLLPIIFTIRIQLFLARFLYLTLPYFVYTFFELIASGGTSFYIGRAFEFAQLVDGGLESARPNPQSQVANWVIISVFGGLLFLSTIFSLWKNSIALFKGYWKEGTPQRYLEASTLLASIILVFNTAAHMEVERIWHWIFGPVWILAAMRLFTLRESSTKYKDKKWNLGSVVVTLQFITTLILAMLIQDYY